MRCSLFMFAASVCRGSSWLHCAKMAEQIKMLFGVNTPEGPWNIVLKLRLDPPQRGRGGPILNVGTPLLSLEWLKLEIWNFARIQKGEGPNENYATVRHMRTASGLRDVLFAIPAPPYLRNGYSYKVQRVLCVQCIRCSLRQITLAFCYMFKRWKYCPVFELKAGIIRSLLDHFNTINLGQNEFWRKIHAFLVTSFGGLQQIYIPSCTVKKLYSEQSFCQNRYPGVVTEASLTACHHNTKRSMIGLELCFSYIIRLHRIDSMQTIVTDVRSVCQSVRPSVCLSRGSHSVQPLPNHFCLLFYRWLIMRISTWIARLMPRGWILCYQSVSHTRSTLGW